MRLPVFNNLIGIVTQEEKENGSSIFCCKQCNHLRPD